ncbi:PPOX class F420-dependent oxidoreductase [Saccharopolyspora taberi]|uniref:PPOX class F420-dependent oxidoreductase n=1 Tax=Saccharopolyspora taberi TaxID=60895 RepID=A0ABN3VK24_9PSEU
MAAGLSDDLKNYLDESRAFPTVATLLPDGHPHLTVVWIMRDGEDLLFSTTTDRQQGRNLARDPRVTVMINPAEDPYKYAAVRGIATVTPDTGLEVVNAISLKYTGKLYADLAPDSVDADRRIAVRVTPFRVTGRL